MRPFFHRLLALSLALCIAVPPPVWAWSAEGHELVGGIADRLLQSSLAGQRVNTILGGRTLAQVAGWADCVKSISPEANFEYLNAGRFVDCKGFENPEDIAFMASFVKRNHESCFAFSKSRESCHKHYHYTDLSLDQHVYAAGEFGSAEEDIVQALQATIAKLRGEAVPAPFHFDNDKEALMLLVHLVGDLHQPLHVAGVYLDDEGKVVTLDQAKEKKGAATVGGNALQLELSNLHSMWDKVSPTVREKVWQEQLTSSPSVLPNMSNADLLNAPQLWANETLVEARQAFDGIQYGKKTNTPRGDRWNIELPLKYRERVDQMQVEAISKAGYRLASLLQAIYS